MLIEGAQHHAERRRDALDALAVETQNLSSRVAERVVAHQRGQPRQRERCDRGAGGKRAVVPFARAGDQGLVVARREEEPTGPFPPEQIDHPPRQDARLRDPGGVEGGLVQIEERRDQKGVVGQVRRMARLAVHVSVQQPAVAGHLPEDQASGALRCLNIAGLVQDAPAVCQRRDHQAVPVRQDLVVAARTHAALAGPQQPRPGGGHPQTQLTFIRAQFGGDLSRRLLEVQDAPAVLEVPSRRDTVHVAEQPGLLRPEDLGDLFRRPDVVRPLLALAVGVEGRIEPALRGSHLAQHPLEDVARHAPEDDGGRRAALRQRRRYRQPPGGLGGLEVDARQ